MYDICKQVVMILVLALLYLLVLKTRTIGGRMIKGRGDGIMIYVRTPDGQRQAIEVDPGATVADVRSKILSSPEPFKLKFQDELIQDNELLSESGISAEATIDIIPVHVHRYSFRFGRDELPAEKTQIHFKISEIIDGYIEGTVMNTKYPVYFVRFYMEYRPDIDIFIMIDGVKTIVTKEEIIDGDRAGIYLYSDKLILESTEDFELYIWDKNYIHRHTNNYIFFEEQGKWISKFYTDVVDSEYFEYLP